MKSIPTYTLYQRAKEGLSRQWIDRPLLRIYCVLPEFAETAKQLAKQVNSDVEETSNAQDYVDGGNGTWDIVLGGILVARTFAACNDDLLQIVRKTFRGAQLEISKQRRTIPYSIEKAIPKREKRQKRSLIAQ